MRYYHKCTVIGLLNLLTNTTDEPLCLSTDSSYSLFWRDVCVVINTNKKELISSDTDLDSRGNSEYDEVRISFSKEELINSISHVIISKKSLKEIKGSKYYSPDPINHPVFESFVDSACGDFEKAENAFFKYFTKQENMQKMFQAKFKLLSETKAKKEDKKWDSSFLRLSE